MAIEHASKKKKSMMQELGLNVELTTKKLETDNEEARLIKRIGEERCPDRQEYVGTVLVHYYIDKSALAKTEYDICSLTHIALLKDINENLVALGMNNAVVAVRKYFNPEFTHKSTNKLDTRNTVGEGKID